MAIIKDIGAHRMTFPGKLGETIALAMYISKDDELKINGVKIDLPEECYNLKYTD